MTRKKKSQRRVKVRNLKKKMTATIVTVKKFNKRKNQNMMTTVMMKNQRKAVKNQRNNKNKILMMKAMKRKINVKRNITITTITVLIRREMKTVIENIFQFCVSKNYQI